YDRKVSEAAAAANELVGQFRLHLAFVNARSNESQHAAKAALSDRASVAKELDFRVRFDAAQRVHQTRQAAIIVQRIPRLAIPNETRVARFNLGDGAFVFVAVEINVVALAHQPVEQSRKVL